MVDYLTQHMVDCFNACLHVILRWLPTLNTARNTVYMDQTRVEHLKLGKNIENDLLCWLNVGGKTLDFQYVSLVRIFFKQFLGFLLFCFWLLYVHYYWIRTWAHTDLVETEFLFTTLFSRLRCA